MDVNNVEEYEEKGQNCNDEPKIAKEN